VLSSVTHDDSSGVAASVWDAREAAHMRSAVFAAPMRDEPSAHIYVENVFSPPTYAAMLEMFPTDSLALRRWSNPGDHGVRFGNYSRRREVQIPSEAERLSLEQRDFWLQAAEIMHGEQFARTLLERFEPYARARFGDRIDDPSFVRDNLRGTMLLNQHDADYYLGPHTDRGEKVFTCLFYFPEHEGLEHLGTTLYRPLEAGFTCPGVAHHDPARFERGETAPYRANSAFVFARTDVMFHGVHPLTADELNGSKRRSIQMQFWVHNERPREACKTTLFASLPLTMQTSSDLSLPYHLTNDASLELDSEFPYTTHLGYRWLDPTGREVEPDNRHRSPLPRALAAGESATGSMRIVGPATPGRYSLRASVIQEGVAWFDDIDPRNGVSATVLVQGPARIDVSAAPLLATDGRSDIAPQSDAIALGDGWHPLEREGASLFRWVADSAHVFVAALRPIRHDLRIVVEPGPGVGLRPFRLAAHLSDGREIGAAIVAGKSTVTFTLPAESPRLFEVSLHAAGGGSASPGDDRILNFRVFSLDIERTVDVFPAWAVPQSGFYPPEGEGADLFRWVSGEATIQLEGSGHRVLEFEAESGPSMGSQPFRLGVFADGVELHSAEVGTRTRVCLPLPDAAPQSLVMRADGGGMAIAGDPRTLNFRVFAAKAY